MNENPQKNPLMSIYYSSVDIDLSDHRPIVGLFEAKIKTIDQNEKAKVIEILRKKYHYQVAMTS